MNIDHTHILDIFYCYYNVSNQGKINVLDKIVNFCWIPSQIGIHGNNEADEAAKLSIELEIVTFDIPIYSP